MKEPNSKPVTKEELKKLPLEAIQVFASRCALRVFPVLGYKGNFDFWDKKDRKYYVGAIEVASCSAFLKLRGGKGEVFSAAANAANAAAYAAAAANAANAADAAYAAADDDARADYELLLSQRIKPVDIFKEPLWRDGFPKGWEALLGNFIKALDSLKSTGASEIGMRYTKLIDGTVDYAGYLRATDSWYKEHQQREAQKTSKSNVSVGDSINLEVKEGANLKEDETSQKKTEIPLDEIIEKGLPKEDAEEKVHKAINEEKSERNTDNKDRTKRTKEKQETETSELTDENTKQGNKVIPKSCNCFFEPVLAPA